MNKLEYVDKHYMSCWELGGSCCTSCMTDADYGYPMGEVEFQYKGHTFIMSVCCKHSAIVQGWTPYNWYAEINKVFTIKEGHKVTSVIKK